MWLNCRYDENDEAYIELGAVRVRQLLYFYGKLHLVIVASNKIHLYVVLATNPLGKIPPLLESLVLAADCVVGSIPAAAVGAALADTQRSQEISIQRACV